MSVRARLEDAIRRNKRPSDMLYEFLSSGTKEANFLANQMVNNPDVLVVITSPAGRKWIHLHLDQTLDYLQQFTQKR
jgi:hypothetical protein